MSQNVVARRMSPRPQRNHEGVFIKPFVQSRSQFV